MLTQATTIPLIEAKYNSWFLKESDFCIVCKLKIQIY